MDEVNINKYLGQFNPILIVPVLSAVVGAILVFVFGFKRPNEPRFQSNSSSDSLKKSKRKANAVKSSENSVQTSKQTNASSAKVNSGKKANDASATVAGKKGAANEKPNSNNNNNTSSNNNNINKKKTDEKKSDNGSPAKKAANKKIGKENQAPANKKQSKANKNNTSNEFNEKPADFDDGGWFTVQSKSTKQKNKVDESAGNATDNSSPKPQPIKNNKSAKSAKVEPKQSTPPASVNELTAKVPETVVVEQSVVETKVNDVIVEAAVPEVVAEPVIDEVKVQVVEKKAAATVAVPAAAAAVAQPAPVVADVVDNAVVDNAIAFDELGEWTDIKPDRKKGNKKKSRKD